MWHCNASKSRYFSSEVGVTEAKSLSFFETCEINVCQFIEFFRMASTSDGATSRVFSIIWHITVAGTLSFFDRNTHGQLVITFYNVFLRNSTFLTSNEKLERQIIRKVEICEHSSIKCNISRHREGTRILVITLCIERFVCFCVVYFTSFGNVFAIRTVRSRHGATRRSKRLHFWGASEQHFSTRAERNASWTRTGESRKNS